MFQQTPLHSWFIHFGVHSLAEAVVPHDESRNASNADGAQPAADSPIELTEEEEARFGFFAPLPV